MREAVTDGATLIGLTESELEATLGTPTSRSDLGSAVWLVYVRPDLTLRVRCSGPDGARRCASWTAVLPSGVPTLSEAAGFVGLWPHVQPDENASDIQVPLIRRRLDSRGGGPVHSFTAGIRNGLIISVSAFDEPPDWI